MGLFQTRKQYMAQQKSQAFRMAELEQLLQALTAKMEVTHCSIQTFLVHFFSLFSYFASKYFFYVLSVPMSIVYIIFHPV